LALKALRELNGSVNWMHGLFFWPLLAQLGRFPGLLRIVLRHVGREILPSEREWGVQGTPMRPKEKTMQLDASEGVLA